MPIWLLFLIGAFWAMSGYKFHLSFLFQSVSAIHNLRNVQRKKLLSMPKNVPLFIAILKYVFRFLLLLGFGVHLTSIIIDGSIPEPIRQVVKLCQFLLIKLTYTRRCQIACMMKTFCKTLFDQHVHIPHTACGIIRVLKKCQQWAFSHTTKL